MGTDATHRPHPRQISAARLQYYTVFAVEYNASSISYYVNGTLVNHAYPGMPGWSAAWAVPAGPLYLILSQAYMAHRPEGDPPSWAWPIEQRVDYVRQYEWVPEEGDGEGEGEGEGEGRA